MAKRAIMRAADADRERAADRLRNASAEGRLLTEELEERLEAVFAARTYGDLEAVTKDLPREPSQQRRRAPLPIPWPVAALGFMILMPVVVAVAVAAVVLVASMVVLWTLVAAAAMWIFGHRMRFIGPALLRARVASGQREPLARVATRSQPFSSPSSSTARKASCGTSIRPTCFIRCLPFFCCSSSLRLRLMSPP